jgi:galactose mutarotase-like enzyme
MSSSFSTFELKTYNSILGISEQGGYVTDWQVKDTAGNWKPILYVGTELKRTGIPILFPYYGPSESGMGQHGFGRNLKWHIVERSEITCTLEITEDDLDQTTKLFYPHNFQTQIKLTLLENSFEYTLSVKNTGTTPLPIAPGLHPYWAISHNKKAEVKLENYPEFNASEVDWEYNPPDVEYEFKNPVTITFPENKVTIVDQSDSISKLVVWSQPLANPDHDFICFEPVTLERNTYDIQPINISTENSWEMKLIFKLS